MNDRHKDLRGARARLAWLQWSEDSLEMKGEGAVGPIIGSVVVLVGSVAAFYVVSAFASILTTTIGFASYAGVALTPARRAAPFFTFGVLLALYLAWALLCWIAADTLATNGFASRWVLLFAAAALAGAPYHWAQRSKSDSIRKDVVPDETFGSALAYAGGLQTKIVVLTVLSGIYFDWWPGLPG
jgi:hypothetical protein